MDEEIAWSKELLESLKARKDKTATLVMSRERAIAILEAYLHRAELCEKYLKGGIKYGN